MHFPKCHTVPLKSPTGITIHVQTQKRRKSPKTKQFVCSSCSKHTSMTSYKWFRETNILWHQLHRCSCRCSCHLHTCRTAAKRREGDAESHRTAEEVKSMNCTERLFWIQFFASLVANLPWNNSPFTKDLHLWTLYFLNMRPWTETKRVDNALTGHGFNCVFLIGCRSSAVF